MKTNITNKITGPFFAEITLSEDKYFPGTPKTYLAYFRSEAAAWETFFGRKVIAVRPGTKEEEAAYLRSADKACAEVASQEAHGSTKTLPIGWSISARCSSSGQQPIATLATFGGWGSCDCACPGSIGSMKFPRRPTLNKA